MVTSDDDNLAPDRRVDDIPRVLRALREAVRDALRMHKLTGSPVAVWRDGHVQWIPAEEIPGEPTPIEDH